MNRDEAIREIYQLASCVDSEWGCADVFDDTHDALVTLGVPPEEIVAAVGDKYPLPRRD